MKVLKWLLLSLAVLLIGIVLIANFFLGSIIKKTVNTVGSTVVGVPVSLKDSSFRLFRGKAMLEGLVIGNPEGFKTEKAFGLGKISIDLEPASLFTDTIHIRRIAIDAPEISYEMALGSSNIGKLIEQLSKDKKGEDTGEKPKEETTPEPGPGKKVVIDELVIADGKILLSAALLGGAGLPITLPTMEMKDIGKDKGGASPTEVLTTVLSSILVAVSAVVTDSGKFLGKGAGAAVDGAGNAVGSVGEGASGLIKGVGGLLGGSDK